MSFRIVRGNTEPPFGVDLREDDALQDLTGAGIILNCKAQDGTPWTKTLTMGATKGRAQRVWANAAETLALPDGESRGHVTVTFGNGAIKTFPDTEEGFPIHVVNAS